MKKNKKFLLFLLAIFCTICLSVVIDSLIVDGWHGNYASIQFIPSLINAICFWIMAISKNQKTRRLWWLILVSTLLGTVTVLLVFSL